MRVRVRVGVGVGVCVCAEWFHGFRYVLINVSNNTHRRRVLPRLTLRMSFRPRFDRRDCRKYSVYIRTVFQFRIQSFQSPGFRV